MIIKKFKYEDIKKYENKILELLIETYIVNFGLSNTESKDICTGKIVQLGSYIKDNTAILIGAYEDDNLVGYIWLYKHEFFGEKRLHVNQIAVDSNYRGRGIGKSLIKEAEEYALKCGIQFIDLFVSESNSGAYKLYDSIGFETERRYMKKRL